MPRTVKIEDHLRPFWIPGINDVTDRPTLGLIPYVIGSGKYSLASQTSGKLFDLSVSDSDETIDALGFDYDRFASACIESISTVGECARLPKSMAWRVVSTYYAAYYAAHSILRSLGVSCSNIEIGSAGRISQVAYIYTAPVRMPISPGYYTVKFNKATRILSFSETGGRGVHEGFWKVFSDAISAIVTGIAAKPDPLGHGQQVMIKLSELEHILSKGGAVGGSWLSSVRNSVNYRLEHGVWHPFDTKKSSYQYFSRTHQSWIADPLSIDLSPTPLEELKQFINACVFICNICRLNTLDLADKCTVGGSYYKAGTIKLYSLLSA